MPWRQVIPHTRRFTYRPPTDYSFPLIAQSIADVTAEGGYGAVGAHGQQHGIGSHWDIWMAASAMGPMGALEMASVHGAHFLGVEKDLGTLEPAKIADLIVLNSNPLVDIHNTADILYVMKGGIFGMAARWMKSGPKRSPSVRTTGSTVMPFAQTTGQLIIGISARSNERYSQQISRLAIIASALTAHLGHMTRAINSSLIRKEETRSTRTQSAFGFRQDKSSASRPNGDQHPVGGQDRLDYGQSTDKR